MKVRDLLSKEDQTIAIKLTAKKKKKNNPAPSETNPHDHNIDNHYGMSSTDRIDGVLQP